MTKQDFIEELKDIMEIDQLSDDQPLNEIDEFDSLAVMSIVAFSFSNFHKKLSGNDIKNAKSVNDLITLIGVENIQ